MNSIHKMERVNWGDEKIMEVNLSGAAARTGSYQEKENK